MTVLSPAHCFSGPEHCQECLGSLAKQIATDLHYCESDAWDRLPGWYGTHFPKRRADYKHCIALQQAVVSVCRAEAMRIILDSIDFDESNFHSPAGLRIQFADEPKVTQSRPWWDLLARQLRTVGRVFGGAR